MSRKLEFVAKKGAVVLRQPLVVSFNFALYLAAKSSHLVQTISSNLKAKA
jgi:hypothetical protein